MRSMTRIGLIILVAGTAIGLAQLSVAQRGGDQPGGPRSFRDEGRPRPPAPPRGEIGRFTITLLNTTVLLLDTSSGDTWTLVNDDSPEKVNWQPVKRSGHEHHDRRPPHDESDAGPPPGGERDNPPPPRDRGRDN